MWPVYLGWWWVVKNVRFIVKNPTACIKQCEGPRALDLSVYRIYSLKSFFFLLTFIWSASFRRLLNFILGLSVHQTVIGQLVWDQLYCEFLEKHQLCIALLGLCIAFIIRTKRSGEKAFSWWTFPEKWSGFDVSVTLRALCESAQSRKRPFFV